jgi:hypothetical protein
LIARQSGLVGFACGAIWLSSATQSLVNCAISYVVFEVVALLQEVTLCFLMEQSEWLSILCVLYYALLEVVALLLEVTLPFSYGAK